MAVLLHADSAAGYRNAEPSWLAGPCIMCSSCGSALQVLSDDEKRGIYDRFGEQGLKGGFAGAGGMGGMGGMGDFRWVACLRVTSWPAARHVVARCRKRTLSRACCMHCSCCCCTTCSGSARQ